MRMDELKRGFWGYKKDSVYHYVVALEEKASERVAEKEARLEQLEAEVKQQIAELEGEHRRQVAELEATAAALRAENASLRENQAAVFSTMLEAQKYANQLRADSDQQKQQSQEWLSAAIQQRTQQLDGYAGQIQQLRAIVRELLRDFDGKLEEVEHTLTQLSVQAPSAALNGEPISPGLSVIQAKPDKGESEAWKKISFT